MASNNTAEYYDIEKKISILSNSKDKRKFIRDEQLVWDNVLSTTDSHEKQEEAKRYIDAISMIGKLLEDKKKENQKKFKKYYDKYLDMYKKFKNELIDLEDKVLLKYEALLIKFNKEKENIEKSYSSKDIELLHFLKNRKKNNNDEIICYFMGVSFIVIIAYIMGYYDYYSNYFI